ncbi:MAG: DUF2934 domain-containing protein [Isosphaeraceae bacterium]|nr:DUF2934 domain-containing protein [Isosphaeraceae bacterium]
MVPTPDQITIAAYHRWLRRGAAHGRDREDWYAAEQELLFSLNYQVIARHALDSAAAVVVGNPAKPRCRFCERGAPAADFDAPVPVVPPALGNTALFSSGVCSECREQVLDQLEPDFLRFARPFVAGSALSVASFDDVPSPAYVPIAAFKYLVAMALLLLPEPELQYVEDATEWVANPDHDFDAGVIGHLECRLHIMPNEAPRPWVALARRADHDAPLPYILFSLGSGRAVFQAPLPLCVRDDDLDGAPLLIPRACPTAPSGAPPQPIASARVVLAAAESTRETHLQFM